MSHDYAMLEEENTQTTTCQFTGKNTLAKILKSTHRHFDIGLCTLPSPQSNTSFPLVLLIVSVLSNAMKHFITLSRFAQSKIVTRLDEINNNSNAIPQCADYVK